MEELLLESYQMIDPKPDKFSLFSHAKLPPRPNVNSRTTSPSIDCSSPYFRVHSPLTSYESNCETVVRRVCGSPTLAEKHIIQRKGIHDSSFTEEHWFSEVSSFVTTSPPKFLQVIKPYRVLSTNLCTLLVRVQSDPPADFNWFLNDTLIPINSQTFVIQNAVNASTLVVKSPKQGLYLCAASNVAGTSKTYIYITVHYPKKQMQNEANSNALIDNNQIYFINSASNPTLQPRLDTKFGTEVNANLPIKFSCQADDKPVLKDEFETTLPTPSKGISQLRNTSASKHTFIDVNMLETAQRSDYVEFLDNNTTQSQILWRKTSVDNNASNGTHNKIMSISLEGAALMNDDHLVGGKKTIKSARFGNQNTGLTKFPTKPKFIQVPSITQQLNLTKGEILIANVNVLAEPEAEIHWYLNKFQLKSSDTVQISKPAANASTLIHRRPASGIYKIKASNMHGSAVYEMRVVVDGYVNTSHFMCNSQSICSNDEDSLDVSVKKTEGIKDNLPKAPRLISAFPSVHRLKEDQKVTLEVKIDAIPEVSFLWRLNNFEFKNGQNGAKISSSGNSSQLILERAIDGRVEVVALNELGKCTASTKLIIDYNALSSSKTEPYFVDSMPSILTENQKQVTVRIHSLEAGVFQWFLNGQELVNKHKSQIVQKLQQSTLLAPELKNGQQLSVTFTNSTKTIQDMRIVGGNTTAEPPPVPKKQFRIVNGVVQKLNKQQSIEQVDLGTIKVEKTNQDFIETTRIQKHEESYSLLVKVAETIAETLVANIILDAIKESAHQLSLMYNSSESEEEDSVQLEQPKNGLEPAFLNTNETFYCVLNESITITARLKSVNCSMVQWYKEKQKLQNEGLIKIEANSSNIDLTLRNVQTDQAGEYECRASNRYGIASYFCRLIVRNPDEHVSIRSPSPNYFDTVQNISTNIAINKKQDNRAIEVMLADDVFVYVDFTITEDIEISAVLKLTKAGVQGEALVMSNVVKKRNPYDSARNKSTTNHQSTKLKLYPNNVKDKCIEANVTEVSLSPTFVKTTEEVCTKQNKQFFSAEVSKQFVEESNNIVSSTNHQEIIVNFVKRNFGFVRTQNLIEKTEDGLEILVDSGICLASIDSLQLSLAQPTTYPIIPLKKQKLFSISNFPVDKKDSKCHTFCLHDTDGAVSETEGGLESLSTRPKLLNLPLGSKSSKTVKPSPQSNVSTVNTNKQAHTNQHAKSKTSTKSSNKSRSKSAERLQQFRINAMDSLKRIYETNIGQKLRKIQTRRSRSSQPILVETKAAAPKEQRSSDLESGQWYYLSPTAEATENYTIHRYFDSEHHSKVIVAKDKYSANLSTSDIDNTALQSFEHFYKTSSSSTNTIQHQDLISGRITPIRKYVESAFNFDNLIDWSMIANMHNTSNSIQPGLDYPNFNNFVNSNSSPQLNRQQQLLSKNHEYEYSSCESKINGKLEQSIERFERKSAVECRKVTLEQTSNRNEMLRKDDAFTDSALIPVQHPVNSFQPVESTNADKNNYSATKDDDKEKSPKVKRRILHGRVFPLSGKITPTPFLVYTNSINKTGFIIDLAQEWSLVREPQHGHAEAFFFPYAQSQVHAQVIEPKVEPKFEDKPYQAMIRSNERSQPSQSQLFSQHRLENGKQTSLAELEDYLKRQFQLIDRETQTTPRLRLPTDQTPGSVATLPHRLKTDSPFDTPATTYNQLYKPLSERPTRKFSDQLEALQFLTLSTKAQQHRKNESNDFQLLKQTLRDVEEQAGRAQRRFHKTVSEDALLIEKTILKVSEELQRRGPLSEAQMLASEELLRSKIAEAILNLKPSIPTGYDLSAKSTPTDNILEANLKKVTEDQAEQIEILREPISNLRDKLGKLEKQIIFDEEESIREELRQINSMPANGRDNKDVKLREKDVRSRSENVARMTPLIMLVKNKLSNLDTAVDQQAGVLDTARRSKILSRFINNENNRSVHKLLMDINNEVSKIYGLCRENKRIDSVNLVVEVLVKVCQSIDAILKAFNENEDFSEISTSFTTTVNNVGSTANVVIKLNKPEQVEGTNTLLMFWNGSDETHNLSTKLDTNFSRPSEQLTTNASVKVQEFAHVRNMFKTASKQYRDKSVKNKVVEKAQTRENVPEINLVSSDPLATKLKVQSQTSDNTQKSDKMKHAEAHLVSTASDSKSIAKTNANEAPSIAHQFDTNTGKTVNQPDHNIIIVHHKNYQFDTNDNNRLLSKSQEEEVSLTCNVPILFSDHSSIMLPCRETDIISSDEDEQSNLQVYDVSNNIWEKFKLKKHRRNYKVNAYVYPACRYQLIATVSHNNFQVDVDCESEYFYDSVVVLANSFYASEAYVPDQLMQHDLSELTDEDTLEAVDQPSDLNNCSRMSVSINARSMNDAIQASLEEVLWNKVAATVTEKIDFDQFVEAHKSGYFNVTVSENQDESKSLKSQESSHRSSQKSLAISEQLSQQSIDVPTYIIKQNSTATITVELNSFVQKNAQIEWFRGRKHIRFKRNEQNKYNRVREDHLEVLVINNVQPSDSELFSITVDKDIYPVAYLIVEDSVTMKENRYFVSPPQTMFVMEGQTAILSCQLVNSNMNLIWYKDDELLVNDDRHTFQQDNDNWYRVIIDEVTAADQGVYYAKVDNYSTNIDLVVEEPIDEKEVQVSNMDLKELSDYLIPEGSNATISCELDDTLDEDSKRLIWLKNDLPIEFSGQGKFEHVRNSPKHFLILHSAAEQDSGVYSVSINNTVFNIAKITVGQGRQLAGSRLKQISSSSICI